MSRPSVRTAPHGLLNMLSIVAITHIYNDTGHAEVIAQANREATWKQRCFVQLQQIGICELRGSMAGFIGSVTRLRGKNAGGRQCSRCCVKRVHFLGPHAPFPRTKNAGQSFFPAYSSHITTPELCFGLTCSARFPPAVSLLRLLSPLASFFGV